MCCVLYPLKPCVGDCQFERMSSHLANERTFLAWVRTAVSVAGLAVTFASLAPTHLPAVFWASSSYSWAVALGVFTVGVSRYHTIKEVLNRPKDAINQKFGRRGITFTIVSFGAFLVLCSVFYIDFMYSAVN